MADPRTGPDHHASRWTIDDLLVDPGVSFALKAVLQVWEERDPVDAAHDARLLAEVLERRADEAVSWAP
jgi:hypothetical protein